MKQLLLFPLLVAALIFWSCGDDNATPTATTGAATSTPPAITPTSAASPIPSATSSQIAIDVPAEGATVAVPITMSGMANVFEGALTIDALGNAAGLVLCKRHLQATSGTGTPGTWRGVLGFMPPNTPSPITLRAYTFSAADGSMQEVVERSVTVATQRPAIVITSPACAAEVSGTLMVSGMALVFEAVLHVDIRHSSGLVMTQRVMAAGGTEFSPWTATFDLTSLTPGFYDVVAYDLSARDGSIENEFPVQIVVQ